MATLTQLDRCARAVAKKMEEEKGLAPRVALSRAYAICVKSLQKSGFLKVGKKEPTQKGWARTGELAQEHGAKKKKAEFERMKAKARVKPGKGQLEHLLSKFESGSRSLSGVRLMAFRDPPATGWYLRWVRDVGPSDVVWNPNFNRALRFKTFKDAVAYGRKMYGLTPSR